MSRVLLGILLALCACSKPAAPKPVAVQPPVVSEDVLARPVQTSTAKVQHILLAWAELKPMYRGKFDKRAAARDEAATRDVVRSVVKRATSGEPFEKLMLEFSEDLESARLGAGYEIHPDGMTEPEFQALALRLHVGEIGVCRTEIGYHVVKRAE